VARYLLSARQVQTAGAGDVCDGGGLVLRVQANSAAWVFRFTSATGKRRELGLGAAVRNSVADAGKSLTDARDAADAARKLLRNGRDPIDVKVAEREAARKAEAENKASAKRERTTLARVARAYHESRSNGSARWSATSPRSCGTRPSTRSRRPSCWRRWPT
jgi:hypothetical protein